MSDGGDDALFEAVARLLPATLNCMSVLEAVQQRLHPPHLPGLAELVRPRVRELETARDGWEELVWPRALQGFAGRMTAASRHALYAGQNLLDGGKTADFSLAMRSIRSFCRAQEALYPLHPLFRPVSRYFLEAPLREDEALLQALDEAAGATDGPGGIRHIHSERGTRGGFSLYVPERLDGAHQVPLVVALHGGGGHGRDFLWNWLREARSRNFVLLCPTSLADTWPLAGPDLDGEPLRQTVARLQRELPLDPARTLLTGMSDGASYALLLGLQPDSPFTQLAAFSGVLHPDLLLHGLLQNARNKPVSLVHGTLDWMFPVERARQARDELQLAGAELRYREIPGLSHAYARSEQDALLRRLEPPGGRPRVRPKGSPAPGAGTRPAGRDAPSGRRPAPPPGAHPGSRK